MNALKHIYLFALYSIFTGILFSSTLEERENTLVALVLERDYVEFERLAQQEEFKLLLDPSLGYGKELEEQRRHLLSIFILTSDEYFLNKFVKYYQHKLHNFYGNIPRYFHGTRPDSLKRRQDALQFLKDIKNPLLDTHLALVERYVEAINYTVRSGRKTHLQRYTEFFNDELKRSIEVFRPRVENGPNFESAQYYWKLLQKEVEHVCATNLADVVILHVIGFKLALLADLSHLTSKESEQCFWALDLASAGRMLKRYVSKETLSTIQSLKEILTMDLISEYHKFNFSDLSEIVPVIDNTPIYGINAFFCAFFAKLRIVSYTPNGSDDAHAGYVKNFYNYNLWLSLRDEKGWTPIYRETFPSSVVFLDHDWGHFAPDFTGNVLARIFDHDDIMQTYQRLLQKAVEEQREEPSLVSFGLLFLLAQDWAFTLGAGCIFIAPNFSKMIPDISVRYNCKTILELSIGGRYFVFTDYVLLNPATLENGRDQKIIDAASRYGDAGTLLRECGLDMRLDEGNPHLWGEAIAQALIEYLRNDRLGQYLNNASGTFDLETFTSLELR